MVLQSCLFSIANIVIQSAINSYGSGIMAGCSAAMSIENFLYLSMNSVQQATQTFTSQNLGAGKLDRIGKIMVRFLQVIVVLGLSQSALTCLFAPQLIGIYNTDAEVIAAGVERLLIVASTYTLWGIADTDGRPPGVQHLGPAHAHQSGGHLYDAACWICFLDTSAVSIRWVHASFPLSWLCILSVLIPYWLRLRRRQNPKP